MKELQIILIEEFVHNKDQEYKEAFRTIMTEYLKNLNHDPSPDLNGSTPYACEPSHCL